MGKRIAILCHGQAGDAATCSSVLRYKNELWGDDCKITWFIAKENADLLKYQDIEVREFPRGFGYPEMVIEENRKLVEAGLKPVWEDWSGLVDENNHLNLELAKNCPSLAEFDFGAFPAPHQVPLGKRRDVSYPNVSKKIFGVPDDWEWHPVLKFSDEERKEAEVFLERQEGKNKILIETFAGSGQSLLNERMILNAINTCNNYLEDCVFIFASHKFLRDNEQFPDYLLARADTTSCVRFTVRQCALIAKECQLMISVSSGITVAASCWENKNDHITPIIQYAGSEICGTRALSLGRFILVTHDLKPLFKAEREFDMALKQILNEIK